MEPLSHDENNNPKSLGHIGYNTAFKNKIQFKNNFFSKKLARTPLKSKLNLMNSSQEDNSKNIKALKYPLLKSISSTNINNHNKKKLNISYDINSNEIYDYDEEDEDEYNKDALPDKIEDFMHINEKEINIENDVEEIDNNIIKEITGYKKHDMKILENIISPLGENGDNYELAAHFDEGDEDDDNNGNEFNSKKKFDDYFNEPDDIDIIDSDN